MDIQVVHRVPEELTYGCLYVCFDCNVTVHLCACGCGEKVVLPIDPDFWSVRYDGENISLTPSVGNFQFPCKSHYWIRDNAIIWVDDSIKELPKPANKKRKKKRRLRERLKKLFN